MGMNTRTQFGSRDIYKSNNSKFPSSLISPICIIIPQSWTYDLSCTCALPTSLNEFPPWFRSSYAFFIALPESFLGSGLLSTLHFFQPPCSFILKNFCHLISTLTLSVALLSTQLLWKVLWKKKTIQAGKVTSSYSFRPHSIEGIQDRNSREESGLENMEKFCLFSHSLTQVAFLYSPGLPA